MYTIIHYGNVVCFNERCDNRFLRGNSIFPCTISEYINQHTLLDAHVKPGDVVHNVQVDNAERDSANDVQVDDIAPDAPAPIENDVHSKYFRDMHYKI